MSLFHLISARSRQIGPKPKRKSIRRHEVSFELLERRTLLSSGLNVGINLDAIGANATDDPFANVMEMAYGQWSVTSAAHPGTPWSIANVALPPMDQNGYPIGLGNLPAQGYAVDTFVFTSNGQNYPTGTYTLTFDGDGTIKINDSHDPIQTFTQSGGTGQPHNVTVSATSGLGIMIAITSSNPSDYVRNIRLVMPGLQSTYQSQPFNPQYLSELQPFATLRFGQPMLPDLESEPGPLGDLSWSERTPPTYFTQAISAGMSVEYMVDLANTLHENMWVTMPVNADSNYEQNFADYVLNNLDPGLKVYVEYGNEIWNSLFKSEYDYVSSYASAHGITQPQAMADMSTNCWDVWLQAFAGQTDRVVRVLASQFADPGLFSQEIARLVATSSPTDPDHGFDIISGAAYFSPDTSSFNAQTTVQQIESAEISALNGTFAQQLQAFMVMRAYWEAQLDQNIPVIMYEGGVGLSALGGPPWYNAYVASQTDPGEYGVITAYLDELQDAGVAQVNYFDFMQYPNQWGEYGSMEYVGQSSSLTPKYNALVGFISSPSLAVTTAPMIATPGEAVSVTVTVLGPGNSDIDTGYSGTVQLTSTDPYAVLPASYTFTDDDAGVHTFTIQLETGGTQTITATDVANQSIAGSTSVTVTTDGTAARFVEEDQTTQGNWIGTYGTQGSDVIGDTASLPSYVTVTPNGQSSHVWASTTTDPAPSRTRADPAGSPPPGTRLPVSRWTST